MATRDTGNHVNTHRLIRELGRAGAAGVHLEDQAFPKRCGHMEGKRLDTTQAMVDKIAAAVDARTDADFVVVARTDALAVEGFEAAIERGARFREAGADVIFIEARSARNRSPPSHACCPGRNGSMRAGTASPPLPPLATLDRMGYRLVTYPDTVFRRGEWRAPAARDDPRHRRLWQRRAADAVRRFQRAGRARYDRGARPPLCRLHGIIGRSSIMQRRTFLLTAASALASPAIARADAGKVAALYPAIRSGRARSRLHHGLCHAEPRLPDFRYALRHGC